MKQIFLFFLLVFLFNDSFSQRQTKRNKFIDTFYRHEKDFNSLVDALKEDSTLNDFGHIYKRHDLSPSLQAKLTQLGIDEVYLFSWGKKQKQFNFKTNWSSYPFHLYYNTLDTAKTNSDFYHIDKYRNETWGLGNSWAGMRVKKYIKTKR